jgi:hypothetical protein
MQMTAPIRRIVTSVAVLIATVCGVALGQNSFVDPTGVELGELGSQYASRVDSARYLATLRALTVEDGSRSIGRPGNVAATEYIANIFDSLGFEHLSYQRLQAPVARQDFAYMVLPGVGEVLGDTIPIQCLIPNFARTNTIPPGGMHGRLVHTVKGEVSEYNGHDLDGSILLTDATAGQKWRLAAALGCRAAVFIESEDPNIRTGGAFGTSVNFPRFIVSPEVGRRLKRWTAANPDVSVSLHARQPWENVVGNSVFAMLPGTDPVLSSEAIIITAPFDALTMMYERAPGAEAALSAATMIELAHILHERPPSRTVFFAALNGQQSAALLGGRHFVLALKRDYTAALKGFAEILRADIRLVSDRALVDKFPEYMVRSAELENELDAVLGDQMRLAEERWLVYTEARAAYWEFAAVTNERRGAELRDARSTLARELQRTAADFRPAFDKAADALIPILREFARLHEEFVSLLLNDQEDLSVIVKAGEHKIRTTIAERLSAARLSDVEKALTKATRIHENDHMDRLNEIRDQYALVEPLLERYPALLVDLSVTSGTDDVGVFHMGYMYNQQPVLDMKRLYGQLGYRFSSYATNMTVVNDMMTLWSMSDEEIRARISEKSDRIDALRSRYEAVAHLTTANLEQTHTYALRHRIFNSSAWLLCLLLAGFLGWRIRKWKAEKDTAFPRWYLVCAIGSVVVSVALLMTGFQWRSTTKIYHGINELIWEHSDLLVNAHQLPREDKTRIRLGTERHLPYTELTEAPEFFADNIIAAIPSTIADLRRESGTILLQYEELEKLSPLREVHPARLSDSQLADMEKFIGFLDVRSDRNFVDAVGGVPGKVWDQYIPDVRFFTSEIASIAGIPGVALSTIDDQAPMLWDARSTIERVDVSAALTQTKTITALLSQVLADPYLPDDIELTDGFAEAHGVVLYDDRKGSVVADVPVDSVILIADRGMYRFTAFSDERGRFDFYGLPMEGKSLVASRDDNWLHAYKLHPDSGHVFFALDVADEQYAFEPKINQQSVEWMLVMFECTSVSVTNVIDQRYFQYLPKGEIFDARTDAPPWNYFAHIAYGTNTFFMRGDMRVKLLFKQGMLGVRSMLTNVPEVILRPEHRQGIGFPVRAETLLTHTTYQMARDMWELDDARLSTLIRHGIIDDGTRDIHEQVRQRIEAASEARANLEYDTYLTEARSALALESRVLPDILDTANGALKGVLFYMALLLPFAFFLERLIIGSVDVRKQALWFFGIFIAMFVLIAQVHPAFDITVAPPMVLLAFTVFALSLFVTGVIIGKFSTQLQQIKKEQQGYLSADVGRVSAMFAAFMLGVSNMRKRKVRTALTCTTLIVLTFTVLSFTSVEETLRVNRLSLEPGDPAYSGVLIRDKMWGFWPDETLPSIKNEFGDSNIVVGRAWREASNYGAGFVFKLEAENGRTHTLSGFVGMEPEEDQVTGIFRKTGIAGRWFNDEDILSLVIPRSAAAALGISLSSVTGDFETAPIVRLEGLSYAVIGVVDDEGLRQLKDLDGEQLTSVDWTLASQARTGRETDPSKASSNLQERETFVHFVPAQSMFMPLRSVYGGLVSVAIKTPSGEAAHHLADRVLPKWALEMYTGDSEGTHLYSTVGLTTLGGLGDVLIPIAIAALIVLNTMLGAVFERTREIGIFSSVGLAPSHIAMLFMAEAAVYAVLGAIAGYLLGQTIGQAVYQTGMLEGLTLNYSSLSAVASTVIVMATVLLSTAWPAKKASELSVPDIARTWRLPAPRGDDWYFALPFTLLDEELEGVYAFLANYLHQHNDESANDFYVDNTEFHAKDGQYMLETKAWLAPYDLGVSQIVSLVTVPVPNENGLYQMSLLMSRESGDVLSWVRVNRRYVNFLRKQFLVWRSLTPEERVSFIARGREMFFVEGHQDKEDTSVETVS